MCFHYTGYTYVHIILTLLQEQQEGKFKRWQLRSSCPCSCIFTAVQSKAQVRESRAKADVRSGS